MNDPTETPHKDGAWYWRIRLKNPHTGEKWIRPMRRNGAGLELGEPDFPDGKPLYRLHDLTGRPDHRVIVVEGELCTDRLADRGLLTTTSGAADSAAKADWRWLTGRDVTIWPDNDKAGQRYATEVAERLLALGCTVLVIDVEKLGLPEKGDAVNWLAANPAATAAEIAALPYVEARRRATAGAKAPAGGKPRPGNGAAPGGACGAEEWPEPQPLTVRVAPEPYPRDALPEIVRKAVTEVQGFIKAPVPLVSSSALASMSMATQAHIDVRRANKLEGPSSLFLLPIADSGERKTTCDNFFTKVIREYEAEEADKAKEDIKKYDARLRGWTAEREGIEAAIRTASKAGKEGTASALKQKLIELENQKPEQPRVPRLLRMDDTPENLAWSLAKEWPAAGVASSEAGIVFGAHAMGKDSIMRNLALLNILWDGGILSIGRRTSESFTVQGARLTVALQVQEATLRSFFDRSDGLARGTGFLARFLVSWPESTQGFRPFTEAPEDWPALAAFNRRIAEILRCPLLFDDKGVLTPRMLSLTVEAKAAWVAFHDGRANSPKKRRDSLRCQAAIRLAPLKASSSTALCHA